MVYHGPDPSAVDRVVGQVKDFLEFQKGLGRTFLPRPLSSQRAPEALDRSPQGSYRSLSVLSQALIECRRCSLFKTRRLPVAGQGASNARLMLIGRGPGIEEDQRSLPFVGPAGQLLTKMIQAIQLNREEVYITHGFKCRPPEDRKPSTGEVEACSHFLMEEIRLVNPLILVTLGEDATRTLVRSKQTISELRGRWREFKGRRFLVTHDPGFLMQNPAAKREAWEDLKRVRRGYDGLE